jgi:hypothetical protein
VQAELGASCTEVAVTYFQTQFHYLFGGTVGNDFFFFFFFFLSFTLLTGWQLQAILFIAV